ncbi:beta-L-arabinofuranosidase domain-containing protein [Robertkochia solimangrovi]|uniref:beta-L-arabinofuranosidase domain-containing protein n=1 Tax=Robertkochia solimangrovi TaxID=2213046 RepID=UPI00117E440D|nr:beta-L-arabinofuranosidase domain-containing protein [Robertkochia solimangrovi]TRZ42046.1 hypothetical protein DMZ48_15545 [Robertkochia solimangrovi]
MKRYQFIPLTIWGAFTLLALQSCDPSASEGEHQPIKTSYVKPVYEELDLGSIKPDGWLKSQSLIMAKNSTGHLDEIHAKISESNNGWLGGDGDDWEETPYWLDGAVPLAYQLDDEVLIGKVKKYIDWSIEHQRPSGYFGPVTQWELETGNSVDAENCEKGEDWWPRMIMLKVIIQYYTATHDQRVIPFLEKYFKYQSETLDKCPIGTWTDWAESRGVENMNAVQWLYQINGDPELLTLAEKIRKQSFEWSELLGNRDWVINAAVNPDGRDWMKRHGVNVAMALKEPTVNFQRTGDSLFLEYAKTGFTDLLSLHGLPNGIFSADEDLHGNAPVQGSELCAVVETMYSLEEMIGITGDPFYMDALERTTFNAFPSQTTADFNEKQYFQIANQIEIDRGVYAFTLPFDREMNNVLGARSGYSCCYANMHQGWPKYVQHLWYRNSGNGLSALVYGPNTVTTTVNEGKKISIEEKTNYPFDDQIVFEFSLEGTEEFPFEMRIPEWCDSPEFTLNGKAVHPLVENHIATLNGEWKDKDVVKLKLPMKVRLTQWAENSRAVERGPLVYGLKLSEKWKEAEEDSEGKYFTVSTPDPWNFGILNEVTKDPERLIRVEESVLDTDFEWTQIQAPSALKVQAKRIPDWRSVNGLAHLPVNGRDGFYKGNVAEKTEEITLIPVGFTKLRIMAFPVVR